MASESKQWCQLKGTIKNRLSNAESVKYLRGPDQWTSHAPDREQDTAKF